jgi:RNA polymerase sigma factor (sigma-70 family)
MGTEFGPTTDRALLDQLKDSANHSAWATFMEVYRPVIARRCGWWRLQPADVEDVTSIVLTKLSRSLSSFNYDPAGRFRGWLKKVVDNAVRDFLADVKRRPGSLGSGDTNVQNELEQIAVREVAGPESDADQSSWDLLERAWEVAERVRERTEPGTWESFYLTEIEGRAANEVARERGISIDSVYQHRHRVRKKLQEEAAALQGRPTGESGVQS